jgi:acetoin utilization deacetylase AcuC-like enzyme
MDDVTFKYLFQQIATQVNQVYDPQVIVLCWYINMSMVIYGNSGADGLTNDRLGTFNLTHIGFGSCISIVKQWNKKILALGGGG